MTTVSIHQPAYLPWLGLFDRIARSDIFIILDCVPFEKGSYINRCKIRNFSEKGWQWLTIPVVQDGLHLRKISEVEIISEPKKTWADKHARAIESSYGRAPFFSINASLVRNIRLCGLGPKVTLDEGLAILFWYLFHALIRSKVEIFRASQFRLKSTKGQLILDLCMEMGATKYLSGPLGRDYLDVEIFEASGVEVEFHDFRHPVYTQMHGEPFIPGLSAIDWLFNTGMPWDPKRPWEKAAAHAF